MEFTKTGLHWALHAPSGAVGTSSSRDVNTPEGKEEEEEEVEEEEEEKKVVSSVTVSVVGRAAQFKIGATTSRVITAATNDKLAAVVKPRSPPPPHAEYGSRTLQPLRGYAFEFITIDMLSYMENKVLLGEGMSIYGGECVECVCRRVWYGRGDLSKPSEIWRNLAVWKHIWTFLYIYLSNFKICRFFLPG